MRGGINCPSENYSTATTGARNVTGEYAGWFAAFPESTSPAPTASPPISSLSPASGEGEVVVSVVVVVVEKVDEELVVVLCSKI